MAAVGTGVGIYLWVSAEEGDSTTGPIIGTFGGLVVSKIFNSRALKNQREAVLKYNSKVGTSFRVTPSESGISLAIHF